MSVKALSFVWERSPNTFGTLLLELALADYCNDEGVCWPSLETLAFKTRMDERHVRRTLRKLEKQGILTIQKNKGPNGVNLYKLSYKGVKLVPRTNCPPDISCISGGANDAEEGTNHAQKDVRNVPQTVREPSLRTVIKKGNGEIEKSPFKPGELPPPPKPPQHVIDRMKQQDEVLKG